MANTIESSEAIHLVDAETQYATFKLDQDYFGVEVLRVQEILRRQEMTHVPLAPPYVSGLINLRGQIVTAIDLGALLTGRAGPARPDSMNVVVNNGDDVVSLLVDEIGDVVAVQKSLLEPAPATLTAIPRSYLKGVCQLAKAVLMVLDLGEILEIESNK